MSRPLPDRLVTVLSRKSAKFPDNINNAIGTVLDRIQQGKVILFTPSSIIADISREPIASFEYLRCPKCGTVYEWGTVYRQRGASSTLRCPECNNPLIQAFVGPPVHVGFTRQRTVNRSPQPQPSPDYDILPTSQIAHLWCSRYRRFKGLKAENPKRPFYSLRLKCPVDDRNCDQYNRGFCNEGGGKVFFQRRGGLSRAIALPSEGLTKPFSEVIFEEVGELEDHTKTFNELLGIDAFRSVVTGKFRVDFFTLFYLTGHNYAARWNRLPTLVMDNDENLWIANRSMTTSGLLLSLDPGRVSDVVSSLANFLPVDDDWVAHSVSHVAMKSIVRLTGLSFREFGEAIYVANDKREVLIYDDSPGGIGGIKTAGKYSADFVNYLIRESRACPRACRSACWACLYLENCVSLNFLLSWMAAYRFLRIR